MDDRSAAELVMSATDGDEDAWHALVDRFTGLTWSIARAHRLGAEDAADVVQTSWLRLVEHLGNLREPDRVGAWLAATVRHESRRVLRQASRERPGVEPTDDVPDTTEESSPETAVLESERRAALWQQLEQLPQRCRSLLRVLAASPPPSYAEVAEALDIPVGSIGPTRARCLGHLRNAMSSPGATPVLQPRSRPAG